MRFKNEKEISPEGSGSGLGKDSFLKIVADRPIVVAFRGDPEDFYSHWMAGGGQMCTRESGKCVPCENKIPRSFRFRINVAVKEGNEYVMKVWEQGRTIYNTLRDLHEEYGLDKTLIKIVRKGSTKDDTSYTLMPAKDGLIKPETEAKLSALVPHQLTPKKKEQKTFDEVESPGELETPFDPEDPGF